MLNKSIVIILSKTPGLSPVKTRLAKDIGEKEAKRFQIEAIDILKEKFVKQKSYDVIWALKEKEALTHYFWQDQEKIKQRGDNLNQILYNLYQDFTPRYKNIIFLGSDSPHLKVSLIDEVIKKLESADFVVGPTEDGGFYTLGGKKDIDASLWDAIPMSSQNTCKELLTQLKTIGSTVMLKEDFDVDDASSYQKWLALNN